MGSVKEWWFDLQRQEMEEWIRQRLGDDADETTEGWEELEREYSDYIENLGEEAELEHEYHWYQEHRSSELYENFCAKLKELDFILNDIENPLSLDTLYKMVYVHSVTLLESFLSDSLKSLIVQENRFLENAVRNIPELRNIKPTLEEILIQENIVTTRTLKWFSEVMFHNFKKVVKIYSSVLERKIDIDLEEVCKVASIRHDIVHRNGKTIEGDTVLVNKDSLHEAINNIGIFARRIQDHVFEAKNA